MLQTNLKNYKHIVSVFSEYKKTEMMGLDLFLEDTKQHTSLVVSKNLQ